MHKYLTRTPHKQNIIRRVIFLLRAKDVFKYSAQWPQHKAVRVRLQVAPNLLSLVSVSVLPQKESAYGGCQLALMKPAPPLSEFNSIECLVHSFRSIGQWWVQAAQLECDLHVNGLLFLTRMSFKWSKIKICFLTSLFLLRRCFRRNRNNASLFNFWDQISSPARLWCTPAHFHSTA